MDSTNAKTIAVVIIIAVLGFFLYQQFSGSETNTLTATDANGQPITVGEQNLSAVGADIQALLTQINSVKIDSEIFTNPAYQSLTDLRNEVPALPQGKKNPFAPFTNPTPTKPAPKAR